MIGLAIFDIILGAVWISLGVYWLIRYNVKIADTNINDESTVGISSMDGRRVEMTGKEFFSKFFPKSEDDSKE